MNRDEITHRLEMADNWLHLTDKQRQVVASVLTDEVPDWFKVAEEAAFRREQLTRENPNGNMFTVAWSHEDGEYVATHSAYPSLSWLDRNPLLALNNLLTIMIEENEWVPPQFTS